MSEKVGSEGRAVGTRERRRPGTEVGTATYVSELGGRSAPRGGRPGATTVLQTESAKIVAFEFEPGDELREHAAHHPIVVQAVRGLVEIELPDRTIMLGPGQVLHLTPQLRHAVRAAERATLTVTMLLPHDDPAARSDAG